MNSFIGQPIMKSCYKWDKSLFSILKHSLQELCIFINSIVNDDKKSSYNIQIEMNEYI